MDGDVPAAVNIGVMGVVLPRCRQPHADCSVHLSIDDRPEGAAAAVAWHPSCIPHNLCSPAQGWV